VADYNQGDTYSVGARWRSTEGKIEAVQLQQNQNIDLKKMAGKEGIPLWLEVGWLREGLQPREILELRCDGKQCFEQETGTSTLAVGCEGQPCFDW
jgi:hypothetical protein